MKKQSSSIPVTGPLLAGAFRAALPALWLLVSAAGVHAAERQTVNTHMAEVTSQLQRVASLPATNRLQLDLGLPLRNRETLTNLFHQLYDRRSTNFHRYLTPEEFAEQFGPLESDYQRLADYARSNHLNVVRTFGNRALLEVEGSVADIERTFQVHLSNYQHPTENRLFHAPDVEPTLDASLPVLYLAGLDNYVSPHHRGHRTEVDKSQGGQSRGGSYSNGLYIGNDFRHAYVPGTSLTGAGQVIGLWEEDGYTPSDIVTYENAAGISPTVRVVNVLASNAPGNNNDEVASDIELVIAMAPGIAQVNVYEGSHSAIINAMATINTSATPRPNQISCSWGIDGDSSLEQGLMQLAMQGQTFVIAVGDSGAYPNGVLNGTEQDYIYMTAVGGTQLSMNGAGASWQSEVVWHDDPGTKFQYFSSTGGVLPGVPIPDYQKRVSMALNHGSTQYRNVPDIAMVARDIEIVYTTTPTNGPDVPGSFTGWVGTSAAAPLFAGVIALANQKAAQQGKSPVGFINPSLYEIAESQLYAACFHDITNGNNSWNNPANGTGTGTLYPSEPGYDLCTGWGSPASTGFIDALVGYSGPVFLDFNYTGSPQNGQYTTPFETLAQGVSGVTTSGTIIIKTGGTSHETMTISKRMTISAGNGSATIGH